MSSELISEDVLAYQLRRHGCFLTCHLRYASRHWQGSAAAQVKFSRAEVGYAIQWGAVSYKADLVHLFATPLDCQGIWLTSIRPFEVNAVVLC